MAATPITTGSINRATTTIAETNGDAANGNSFTNDGRTQLWYRNAGATPRTITITTTKTVGPDALTVQDPVVTVAASSDSLSEADVTPHMISMWGLRGWITRDGTRRHLTVVGHHRGQKLFRYGDILDAEGDTRRNPNSSRSTVRRLAS